MVDYSGLFDYFPRVIRGFPRSEYFIDMNLKGCVCSPTAISVGQSNITLDDNIVQFRLLAIAYQD